MERLAIIAFLLLIVQGILTYFQISDYRKRISVLSKVGKIGIGTKKGFLRAGCITILACDNQGRIIRGEKLEGITIFERFKEIKGIEGLTLQELKIMYPEEKEEEEETAEKRNASSYRRFGKKTKEQVSP